MNERNTIDAGKSLTDICLYPACPCQEIDAGNGRLCAREEGLLSLQTMQLTASRAKLAGAHATWMISALLIPVLVSVQIYNTMR
eukprot:COSAG01_NODE_4066_length_5385_cov_159.277336_5_plen_84_part_00